MNCTLLGAERTHIEAPKPKAAIAAQAWPTTLEEVGGQVTGGQPNATVLGKWVVRLFVRGCKGFVCQAGLLAK